MRQVEASHEEVRRNRSDWPLIPCVLVGFFCFDLVYLCFRFPSLSSTTPATYANFPWDAYFALIFAPGLLFGLIIFLAPASRTPKRNVLRFIGAAGLVGGMGLDMIVQGIRDHESIAAATGPILVTLKWIFIGVNVWNVWRQREKLRDLSQEISSTSTSRKPAARL